LYLFIFPYAKVAENKELSAILSLDFSVYLVCPLYRVALLSLALLYHLGMQPKLSKRCLEV
jgi:hypothetical protein